MKNVPIYQPGYTLVELIITVTIIAVIAAIAVPGFSSSRDRQLQLAAEGFAAAIRFARTESLRTGERHGIHYDSSERRIRVWRADNSTTPAAIVYDVYDPVSKQVYDYDLDRQSFARVGKIAQNAVFRGVCANPEITYFDATGTPFCNQPDNPLLESFELVFASGSATRRVELHGVTGRVTVR